jgi:fluoride ion exporter CrcB/FEX
MTKVLTALIPAILGIILAGLGFLAKTKENLRKHIMHAAVLVGLLGFMATVSSVMKLGALFAGTAERPLAVVSQFATAIICIAFVALSVKSFIDARRSGAV